MKKYITHILMTVAIAIAIVSCKKSELVPTSPVANSTTVLVTLRADAISSDPLASTDTKVASQADALASSAASVEHSADGGLSVTYDGATTSSSETNASTNATATTSSSKTNASTAKNTSATDTKTDTKLTLAQEKSIHNVWAIQYDGSGKIMGVPYYTAEIPIASGGVYTMPMSLTENSATTGKVYFITNIPEGYFDRNNAATIALLKSATTALSIGAEFAPTASSGIPMLGIYTGAVIKNKAFATTTTVKRMMAKVTLNYSISDAFKAKGFRVTGVRIRNAVSGTFFCAEPAAADYVGRTNVWPAKSTTVGSESHTDYPSATLSEANATSGTFTWYVTENLRGRNTAVDNMGDRTLSAAGNNATDLSATYVEITGTLAETDKNPPQRIAISLLLGDAATDIGDFNLQRNHTYTVTAVINGINLTDQRIEVVEADDAIEADLSNSAIVAPNSGDAGAAVFDINVSKKGVPVGVFNSGDLNTPGLTAKILWQDVNEAGGIVEVHLDQDNRRLTVSSTKTMVGNAVVALYNGTTILWSWHIWVTDYKPDARLDPSAEWARNTAYTVSGGEVHTYGYEYQKAHNGRMMMDRNIGATKSFNNGAPAANDATAIDAYGMFYQWGRKDPLGRAISTTDLATIYTTTNNGTYTPPPIANDATMLVSVQNPSALSIGWIGGKELAINDRFKNWGDGSFNATDAGKGAKGAYDPCPKGWRVPQHNNSAYVWRNHNGLMGDFTDVKCGDAITTFDYYYNGTTATGATPNICNGRLYAVGNGSNAVRAWLPSSGQRRNDNGLLYISGRSGYLWTATIYDDNRALMFASDADHLFTTPHVFAYAFPVRCIEDVPLVTPTVPNNPALTADNNNSAMVVPGSGEAGAVAFEIAKATNGWVTTATLPKDGLVAKVLWQDTPNLISDGDISIQKDKAGKECVVVQSSRAGVNGNAVIALYAPTGTADKTATPAGTLTTKPEILWSWHVWVTDYAPAAVAAEGWSLNTAYRVTGGEVHTYADATGVDAPATPIWGVGGIYNGNVIMDRNLGATADVSTGGGVLPALGSTPNNYTDAWGMHYQWGRKDPFPHATAVANSTTTIPTYGQITGGWPNLYARQTAKNSVKYPGNFLADGSSDDWNTSPDNNLWGDGGAKSVWDPCPKGWRIPKNGTWSNFGSDSDQSRFVQYYNGNPGVNGDYQASHGRLYTAGSNHAVAWYPSSGNRLPYSGALVGVGRNGYLWSSSGATATHSYNMNFFIEGIRISYADRRAYGYPVRCVLDAPPIPISPTMANSAMVAPGKSVTFETDITTWDSYTVGLVPTDVFDRNNLAGSTPAVVWAQGFDASKITLTPNANRTRLTVAIAADAPYGNAVVALMKGTTIVWSWHVWVTDYDVSKVKKVGRTAEKYDYGTDAGVKNGMVHTYYGGTGEFFDANGAQAKKDIVIMDRNFGATSATVSNTGSYGLMYQWGRKDPFKTATADNQNTPPKIGGQKSIAYSVQHPDMFITYDDDDWCLGSDQAARWGGQAKTTAKSPYDPCPEGWRVPKNGTWGPKTGGFDETTIMEMARYPSSGRRDRISGALELVDNHGYSWSSSGRSYDAGYIVNFRATFFSSINSTDRGYGLPVRCLQE